MSHSLEQNTWSAMEFCDTCCWKFRRGSTLFITVISLRVICNGFRIDDLLLLGPLLKGYLYLRQNGQQCHANLRQWMTLSIGLWRHHNGDLNLPDSERMWFSIRIKKTGDAGNLKITLCWKNTVASDKSITVVKSPSISTWNINCVSLSTNIANSWVFPTFSVLLPTKRWSRTLFTK